MDGPLKYVWRGCENKNICVHTNRHLPESHFTLTVIDECAQVTFVVIAKLL